MNSIKKVSLMGRALEVEFSDEKTLRFEDCWLRDHCRCPQCYHAETFQRAKHILQLPDARISSAKVNCDSELLLQWNDGHKSTYKSEFLAQFDYIKWKEARKLKPFLWHGSHISEKVAKIPVNKFLSSIEGANQVFQSLLDYGVALIEGVDPTTSTTEKVCEGLGGVQHTFFGGMWVLSANSNHADTAYTNLPLAAHTDNTYFTEAAGLQIFHGLEHTNGTGGETILVDGFYAATRLKDEHPTDFEFLTTTDIEAEYLGDNRHYTHSAPVISVDSIDNIKQIRFNAYDRAPMAFATEMQCRSYYRSLRNLARYFEDPSNQWQFKLTPGTVAVIDNYRVLHGRTSFTGKRVLTGSYVSRSDWLNRARALHLIQ